MKYILWLITTLILYLGVVLLLEIDYRTNECLFMDTYSPLQWFLLLLFLWNIVSLFNLYVLFKRKKYLSWQIKSVIVFFKMDDNMVLNLILSFIPITHIIIVFKNIFLLLEELNKDTKENPSF